MITRIEDSPLYPIVNPRSIAFFGASNSFMAMGTGQLNSVRALGFEGDIYPVHPKEDVVQGLKAYRSVLDLPETPDLAVLVLPTAIVPRILDECGQKGIKRAIVVSGGFKEVGGEGVELEKELVDVTRKHSIRFLGPNCIGVANPHRRLNTTFLQYNAKPGFIGMASQSGSFVTQIFDYLSKFGLGFSAAFSVGNEANIDIVDCIEYLAVDPNTKVIALYIESIRRGRAFIDLVREVSVKKPVVAFYVGGSEAGRKAGFSHTGALAGPDRLYDGVFRQSGVIRASSIEELFDFAWVLGACPKPKSNRVIIQTHSGGPGAAAADACGRAGLDLPQLSAETREKLLQFVPHTASISNPVDLTFNKNQLDYYSNIPRVLLEEENGDSLMIYFLAPTRTFLRALEAMGMDPEKALNQAEKIIDQQSTAVAKLLENHKKPLVGYSFRSRDDLMIKKLEDLGMPVLAGPERAARAIGALVRYTRLRDKILSGE